MSCPGADALYQKFITSEEYKTEIRKYDNLKAYVEKNSGLKVASKIEFATLYFCLLAEVNPDSLINVD